MAARGLVNGRGPLRRSGRDSAKRVVSDTYTPKLYPYQARLATSSMMRTTVIMAFCMLCTGTHS